MAVETKLGWVMQGPVLYPSDANASAGCDGTPCGSRREWTSRRSEKFWSPESISIESKTNDSTNNDRIVEGFENGIVKLGDRYSISLWWKKNVTLDSNYNIAKKRLMQLTKRLSKNEETLSRYEKAITEYFPSNVADRVPRETERHTTLCYYMPHQAVIRQDRETIKVRVMFDASSSPTKGGSLNDNLEKGSTFTEDILSLLINFRNDKVAVISDVEKTFLHISIHEEDTDALRFLWWKHDYEGNITKRGRLGE